jgi:prepilin-type N-terminal cleavage/methylation domain-containing protein
MAVKKSKIPGLAEAGLRKGKMQNYSNKTENARQSRHRSKFKNTRNLKLRNRTNFGFTLIEMMVVITLLALVATTAIHLFTRIIRANQKARAILAVKQTGDNALAILSQKIRNSQAISSTCSGTAQASITLDSTTITCSPTGIALTGGQNLVGSDLQLNGASSCFNCYRSDLRPDVVLINFTLTNNKTGFEATSLSFSTTVSLRSY